MIPKKYYSKLGSFGDSLSKWFNFQPFVQSTLVLAHIYINKTKYLVHLYVEMRVFFVYNKNIYVKGKS